MMETKLIMLDNPIIVSDERDSGKLAYNPETFKVQFFASHPKYDEDGLKIIAGLPDLPSIDWNSLEEEFGWVDVEKIYPTNQGGLMSMATLIQYNNSLKQEGFKKAQSLNEKKFSLEDMKYIFECGRNYQNNAEITFKESMNYIQQPKVFSIEVEKENNSIKIIRKL